MRPSPQRHPLAALRVLIGLTQKEMAALVKCSTPTIQAVELGKLALSEGLAERISFETGIELGWLLKGDPTAPMPSRIGSPYDKTSFEIRRATMTDFGIGHDAALSVHFNLRQMLLKMTMLLLHAYRTNQFPLCNYKLQDALDGLLAEFKANPKYEEMPEDFSALLRAHVSETVGIQLGEATANLPPPDLNAQLAETKAVLDRFHEDFNQAFKALNPKPSKKRGAISRIKI